MPHQNHVESRLCVVQKAVADTVGSRELRFDTVGGYVQVSQLLHLNYLEQRNVAPAEVTGRLTENGYALFDLSGRRRSERDLSRSWASGLHLLAKPPHA